MNPFFLKFLSLLPFVPGASFAPHIINLSLCPCYRSAHHHGVQEQWSHHRTASFPQMWGLSSACAWLWVVPGWHQVCTTSSMAQVPNSDLKVSQSLMARPQSSTILCFFLFNFSFITSPKSWTQKLSDKFKCEEYGPVDNFHRYIFLGCSRNLILMELSHCYVFSMDGHQFW